MNAKLFETIDVSTKSFGIHKITCRMLQRINVYMFLIQAPKPLNALSTHATRAVAAATTS